MEVCELMTTEVTTCSPSTPFKEVVGKLLDDYVSGVPVVDDDGQLLGIVTEADLVAHEAYAGQRRRLLSVLADRLAGRDPRWVDKAAALQAKDLMTTDVATAGPHDDVGGAARRMLERGVRRLPVVDGERLVGIVARSDLLRSFQRPDDAIRGSVEGLLADPLCMPEPHGIEVTVDDGVVALRGWVRDRADIPIAAHFASRVPGVVAVDNRLELRDAHPDASARPRPPA